MREQQAQTISQRIAAIAPLAKYDNVTSTERGNSADYLVARLKRDHPVITERLAAGGIPNGSHDSSKRVAAHNWNRVPVSRWPIPKRPAFTRPQTLAEASDRYAKAKEEKIGHGTSLNQQEAARAVGGLYVQWIQSAQERLPAAHIYEMFGAAGLQADHGQAHALAIICMEYFATALASIWPDRDILPARPAPQPSERPTSERTRHAEAIELPDMNGRAFMKGR